MVLLIDNYDSFTYNLAQLLMRLGEEVQVVRNDEISVEEAEALDFDRLVISPGPGRPETAGNSIDLIRRFAGQQAHSRRLPRASGDSRRLRGADSPRQADHARQGRHDLARRQDPLLRGAESPARHPLPFPRRRARKPAGRLRGQRDLLGRRDHGHPPRRAPDRGTPVPPESIGTEDGERLIRNFLSGVREVPSVKHLLKRLSSREELTRAEARSFMDQIADGAVSQAQVGAFLAALTVKGPTIEEMTGFASSLYDRAVRVPLPAGLATVDTCGTGGDSSGTFNISTAAAFVAAGAGARVAKHGNRSITSRSGSADVLDALGVSTKMGPSEAAKAIQEAGMAFLFAPAYHPAFKNIMGPRRELGFRTIFNMMGPMLNPARAKAQVVGVYAPELTETVARILANLGVDRALVVHGLDGIDEISLAGSTKVTELRDGWTRTYFFDPKDYGFELCAPADLKGGDAAENAGIVERVLSGDPGPKRDVVVLNAAAAIMAAGIAPDFGAAIEAARASIDWARQRVLPCALRLPARRCRARPKG